MVSKYVNALRATSRHHGTTGSCPSSETETSRCSEGSTLTARLLVMPVARQSFP